VASLIPAYADTRVSGLWGYLMSRENGSISPEQLGRIRQTLKPTVDEWLRDYGIPRDKMHAQLINRVVAAVAAMHQCDVLTVWPVNGK
jgi:hypothetical protein